MFIDPYWARLEFDADYPFGVLVFNVTTLVSGFHPSEFKQPATTLTCSPRRRAAGRDPRRLSGRRRPVVPEGQDRRGGVPEDDARLPAVAPLRGCAQELRRQGVGPSAERADRRADSDFEDFMFWRLVELSARYDLPFQIHTGHARIQGSNPMLLVDLIEANPNTKFILFHGGFPWVGETGVIAMRHGSHVWIDSVWLPTLSYTMAKRAFQEWLETMPSDRIMWGADAAHAEGIYAATEFTRQCLAEALAEKVDRGELREEHAIDIGRQILRDNALALFPQLRTRLWKHKGQPLSPPGPAPIPTPGPTAR